LRGVELVFEPNWSAWRNNIMAIIGKLAELKGDMVVFFILENNVYYALQEDGNICRQERITAAISTWMVI
jgi:hypothetical protein